MGTRIFADTDGNVTVEESNTSGTRRTKFVYRPDLPEGAFFGDCPRCWEHDGVLANDGHIHDGPDNWIICRKHKVKWFWGSGLVSGWRDTPEKLLIKWHNLLSGLQRVEPVLDYRITAYYSENIRFNRDPLTVPPEKEKDSPSADVCEFDDDPIVPRSEWSGDD